MGGPDPEHRPLLRSAEVFVDDATPQGNLGSPPTAMGDLGAEPQVSVVIPCLDEAESIAECVEEALTALRRAGLETEVVVVDNGSRDGSAALAEAAGARVVHEARRGYGRAYLAGFAAARGRYVVMADGDGTYDLRDAARFCQELDAGADVVIGSRLRGTVHPGAMPWLHRRIGNPLLTGLLNIFVGTRVSDAHSGMRAFRRSLLPRLALCSTGMELASEHLVRSGRLGLEIRELPIDYRPRRGNSKLLWLRDGWRHLWLLLAHSPAWLLLLPAALLAGAGLLALREAVIPAGALAATGCLLLTTVSVARLSAPEPVQREAQSLLDGDLRPEAELSLSGGDVRL
jgi:glycosyltransferase involved in cell wall biosynthesis